MKKQIRTTFLLLIIGVLATGCMNRQPPDYTAFKASAPRSIVVIPPANESVEVKAPYIFLSTITRPLAEKGYYVFPVAVVDEMMKQNGLPTTAEMNQVPLDKIKEIIGADAVLYTTIDDWGQRYELASSVSVVSYSMKLVDTTTGDTLWSASGSASKGSGDGGGGLGGLLLGALVTQMMSEVIDNTPQLSREVSRREIQHPDTGLLDGPYARKEDS